MLLKSMVIASISVGLILMGNPAVAALWHDIKDYNTGVKLGEIHLPQESGNCPLTGPIQCSEIGVEFSYTDPVLDQSFSATVDPIFTLEWSVNPVDWQLTIINVTGFNGVALLQLQDGAPDGAFNFRSFILGDATNDQFVELAPNEVPIPAALPLFLMALAALGIFSKRKSRVG